MVCQGVNGITARNNHFSSSVQRITIRERFNTRLNEYQDADIWIFSSDDEAKQGMQWTRENGLKIPRDLSIMGLENNPAFYHLGFLYCGPDYENIGYMMAHALIGDFPLAKTSWGFVRTRSLLLEKQTTR